MLVADRPKVPETNLNGGQKTLVVLSEWKDGPEVMIGEGINDAVDFKIPSEIMNYLGRKGGPQRIEHGQTVDNFLGDGPLTGLK